MEKGQVFGLPCGQLLGEYNPDGSLLKMSGCLPGMDFQRFLITLPRSGMMRNGKIYEQRTWVRRIKGKGSGSWPTNGMIKKFPTPRASDYNGVGSLNSRSHKHGVKRGDLNAIIQEKEQQTGHLNPQWVDWLMGYPTGWTDFEDLGMQLFLK